MKPSLDRSGWIGEAVLFFKREFPIGNCPKQRQPALGPQIECQ
jgi:hypothetical protein